MHNERLEIREERLERRKALTSTIAHYEYYYRVAQPYYRLQTQKA
jgi:hypothetical protein